MEGARLNERRRWEDEVLRLTVLGALCGDVRRDPPTRAPRDWNDVSHLGFRRIFLTDDLPASLVIFFSHEDLAAVVLGCQFPLSDEDDVDPIDEASRVRDAFLDVVRHGLGSLSRHRSTSDEDVIDRDGPRLQWVARRP